MKLHFKITPLFAILIFISGCSSSGGDGNAATPDIVETSVTDPAPGTTANTGNAANVAITGLWDFSSEGDTDYQEFTADGKAIAWDYQADSNGNGADCYRKFGPVDFVHQSGNVFLSVGELVTVVLSADRNQITVTDFEGTFTYPRLVGVSSSDFNAC